MRLKPFLYKGFVVEVERRTVLTDPRCGWTWGKKRSIASFYAYNPETNQRVKGGGAIRKAKESIDKIQHQSICQEPQGGG
jgi:protein-disulfide isomerase-like protein with CxxC motif